LTDAGFRLLVPVWARDGSLLGLIVWERRRAASPFLKEDRKLLVDIANSAALGLELELKETWSPAARTTRSPASQSSRPPTTIRRRRTPRSGLSCGALYLQLHVLAATAAAGWSPRSSPTCCPAGSASSAGWGPAAWV